MHSPPLRSCIRYFPCNEYFSYVTSLHALARRPMHFHLPSSQSLFLPFFLSFFLPPSFCTILSSFFLFSSPDLFFAKASRQRRRTQVICLMREYITDGRRGHEGCHLGELCDRFSSAIISQSKHLHVGRFFFLSSFFFSHQRSARLAFVSSTR